MFKNNSDSSGDWCILRIFPFFFSCRCFLAIDRAKQVFGENTSKSIGASRNLPSLLVAFALLPRSPPIAKKHRHEKKGGDETSRSLPKFSIFFFAGGSCLKSTHKRGATRCRWQTPRAKAVEPWSLVGAGRSSR